LNVEKTLGEGKGEGAAAKSQFPAKRSRHLEATRKNKQCCHNWGGIQGEKGGGQDGKPWESPHVVLHPNPKPGGGELHYARTGYSGIVQKKPRERKVRWVAQSRSPQFNPFPCKWAERRDRTGKMGTDEKNKREGKGQGEKKPLGLKRRSKPESDRRSQGGVSRLKNRKKPKRLRPKINGLGQYKGLELGGRG